MATIRVTCPACKATLEVEADKAGKEVECGECFEVFKVRGAAGKTDESRPGRGKAPAGKPSRPRGRYDEDDDYEHDHQEEYDEDDDEPAGFGRPSGLPSAAGTFGLGLLAFLSACIPFVSIPLAIVTLGRPRAAAYPPGLSGLARGGRFLARVSLGLWLVVLLVLYFRFRGN